MRLGDWFLTAAERGNPATRLDDGRGPGEAWSTGNEVRPLIHGAAYFSQLLLRVNALEAGDLLLFTDWRGDPDELLTQQGPRVADLFCAAARRGVVVRGLVWRSHLDRLQFSQQENRHLGEEINAAGGQCLLDMRVRPGGSHHMKLVVLRHAARPEQDVAFVGGIDLCHSRRDDAEHRGDPQAQPMAAVYGARPPWHDVQLMITGPAVADVETVFRERWDDPAPPTRNPLARLHDAVGHLPDDARRLPPQRPAPQRCGEHAVQLLRTYPYRRPGYPFAPEGERSIARAYQKVLPRARSLIYLEDQYLWSTSVASVLRAALSREHLGTTDDADTDLGPATVKAFRRAAANLDAWHDGGRRGPRPPGQLRSYPTPRLSAWTRRWATVPYRLIFDPDGRPRSLRRGNSF